METNEMTPEKSLQIMNDMIEKSRRDIMKKMGIRAELTSQGAVADSIISIAGNNSKNTTF